MGSLAGVFLSVHTPRYCTLEAAFEGRLASEVFRPVRDGLVAQGGDVADARLDVMAINSCHLITTFPTVVDGTPRHQGVLTAQEAPEIIHGVAYDYPGDYALAAALVARGKAEGRQSVLANDVHYPLDYGTVMPMVCYLDRAQRLPMVPMSVCLSSRPRRVLRLGPHRRPGRPRERQARGLRGERKRLAQARARSRAGARARRTRPSTTSSRASSPPATTRSAGAGCRSTSTPSRRRWGAGTSP